MFHVRHCCVFVCVVLAYIVHADDISIDYYYGDWALRSEAGQCRNTIHQVLCQLTCPGNICVMRGCTCVAVRTDGPGYDRAGKSSYDQISYLRTSNPPGFVDLTKIESVRDEDYPPEMALRHHIAHFCPNLDEARTCIRKCMEVGKPAFCGKDHKCYCGHRYGAGPADKEADAKATYAQFKDLYKKYFGSGTSFGDDNGE